MKKIKYCSLLLWLFSITKVFAQEPSPLTLSDPEPKPGQQITFTYNPAGTPLEGQTAITAIVYFLDNIENPAVELDLQPQKKTFRSVLNIPPTAKAFFIKLIADNAVDNNHELGYIYLVYKKGQPVAGAYASKAYLLSSGAGTYFAKIKTNVNEGVDLFETEFALYPESRGEFRIEYYYALNKQRGAKALVKSEIHLLEQSDTEKDLLFAADLSSEMGNQNASDSLREIARTRFPGGIQVRNDEARAIRKENDPVTKEHLFDAYSLKHPGNTAESKTSLDGFRVQLAAAYLNAGDLVNYERFERQLTDKSMLCALLNNVAYLWAGKGERIRDAEALSKKCLSFWQEKIEHPGIAMYTTARQTKQANQRKYDLYSDTYAYVLFREHKYDDAIDAEQPVIDHKLIVDSAIYEHYVLMSNAVGNYSKAMQTGELAVRTGLGTAALKQQLQLSYLRSKGATAGFNEYLTALENISVDQSKSALLKTMINDPAPDFVLRDLDGHVVNLKDMKGKVVVLDFWATWCIPCKASFPGMQLAVDKYRDDPNVRFLFIDTFERTENYASDAKKYMTLNNYRFHVLLDDKNQQGKQGKEAAAYGVTGIPAKFIIDGNGRIRFKYEGYTGTAGKLKNEVSAMIELAKIEQFK